MLWWQSYVTEIIYNDKFVLEALAHQKRMFRQGMSVIAFLYFGFAFVIIYLLNENKKTAYLDHLTQLPNRKSFEEEMKYKMTGANRKGTQIAILFFDLDKFKEVNDTYGHNVGDKVLKEVANRIKNIMPKGDMVSRLGGDEFIALISDITSKEEVMAMGEKMSGLFTAPLKIGSKEIAIKPSIGISIYPDHGDTVEELVLKADNSMYRAKGQHLSYKIYEN